MRVAIFTNAYKPITSGVVNSVDFISDALREKGHKVYIFAPRFYKYFDDKEGVYRYRSVNFTRDLKFPIAIPFSFKAGKVLKEFRPDIIHTQQPFVLGKVAAYYSRKLNVPLVFTFHTQYEKYSHYIPAPQNLVKHFCRKAIKNFAKRCSCIITPAHSIADLMKSYDIKGQIHVIPNAINLDTYNDISKEIVYNFKMKLGLQGNKVILSVGRIAKEKNLFFLIDAFEAVIRNLSDVRLLIVGDGPLLPELKQYVSSKGVDKYVVFTGNVEYKNIPVLYKIADIFAIASTTEVNPLVILEALAAHVPVVAVNAPGATDTITDHYDGILVNEDIVEFSDGIASLLEDTVLYKKLKRGSEETASRYSIKNISEDIINLYTDILTEKKDHSELLH